MKKKRKKKAFNLNGYIFGALKRIWGWDPEREKALNDVKADKTRLYFCAECGGYYARNLVQVDHIIPVITPEIGFDGWDKYVRQLFVKADMLQILCKKCHKEKTNKENDLRRKKC